MEIETGKIMKLMSDVKKCDHFKALLYFHLWVELSIAHLLSPPFLFPAPSWAPSKACSVSLVGWEKLFILYFSSYIIALTKFAVIFKQLFPNFPPSPQKCQIDAYKLPLYELPQSPTRLFSTITILKMESQIFWGDYIRKYIHWFSLGMSSRRVKSDFSSPKSQP